MKTPVVDLFCGCGAFSTGFARAGLDVVLANDIEEAVQPTYCLNHPQTQFVLGDITHMATKARITGFFKSLNIPCDVVIGGPNCQGFSTVGLRNPDDPRNRLSSDFIDVVRDLSPFMFVMENVKGLMTMPTRRGGDELVVDRIVDCFRAINYRVEIRVLDAADYGVPQHRHRVIIIGSRGPRIAFPVPTHGPGLLPYLTVRDAIDDIKDAAEDRQWGHMFARHSPSFLERIRSTPVGQSAHPKFNSSFYRLLPDLPSRTVQGAGPFIHYEKDRCMTPRELARLQDFDDSFRFIGTKSQIHLMIRNAVPVGLASAIAMAVMDSVSTARIIVISDVDLEGLAYAEFERFADSIAGATGETDEIDPEFEEQCWRDSMRALADAENGVAA